MVRKSRLCPQWRRGAGEIKARECGVSSQRRKSLGDNQQGQMLLKNDGRFNRLGVMKPGDETL
jgi:hypothetical protein